MSFGSRGKYLSIMLTPASAAPRRLHETPRATSLRKFMKLAHGFRAASCSADPHFPGWITQFGTVNLGGTVLRRAPRSLLHLSPS